MRGGGCRGRGVGELCEQTNFASMHSTSYTLSLCKLFIFHQKRKKYLSTSACSASTEFQWFFVKGGTALFLLANFSNFETKISILFLFCFQPRKDAIRSTSDEWICADFDSAQLNRYTQCRLWSHKLPKGTASHRINIAFQRIFLWIKWKCPLIDFLLRRFAFATRFPVSFLRCRSSCCRELVLHYPYPFSTLGWRLWWNMELALKNVTRICLEFFFHFRCGLLDEMTGGRQRPRFDELLLTRFLHHQRWPGRFCEVI